MVTYDITILSTVIKVRIVKIPNWIFVITGECRFLLRVKKEIFLLVCVSVMQLRALTILCSVMQKQTKEEKETSKQTNKRRNQASSKL
jgi:hypothetical protein